MIIAILAGITLILTLASIFSPRIPLYIPVLFICIVLIVMALGVR